jgi:hypothetical protein
MLQVILDCMEPRGCHGESGWILRIASAFTAIQLPPGLTSWVILSRPLRQAQGRLFGTGLVKTAHPGLTSLAILSRPFGTDRDTSR